jgi:CO/xanthine dehydrogenase FAD-binding subunit
MKPARFEYVAASSAADAVRLLGEHGDEALILAGGQSLVPMMNMRLARPTVLIDINDCDDLKFMAAAGISFGIGAGTRQKDILKSAATLAAVPLLLKALAFVGHVQTRNRGTLGGSIAHGDPSAEMPLVAVTLDAGISLRNSGAEREIAASQFYSGPMSTEREPDECLMAVNFPVWNGATGSGFHEVSERHGDFAIVAAAAQIGLDEDGACVAAAIGIGGAHPFPRKAAKAEAVLIGQVPTEDIIAEAAEAAADGIEAMDDVHASSGYRLRVARVLAARAISDAVAEARP